MTRHGSLADLNSPFSAPEGAPLRTAAASPPPTTNPFQAPDFGEIETLLLDDDFPTLHPE